MPDTASRSKRHLPDVPVALTSQSWHHSRERHPDQGMEDLVGYRVRNEAGEVIAELFPRPYLVYVSEEHARLLAASTKLLAAVEASVQCITDVVECYEHNASDVVVRVALADAKNDALRLCKEAISLALTNPTAAPSGAPDPAKRCSWKRHRSGRECGNPVGEHFVSRNGHKTPVCLSCALEAEKLGPGVIVSTRLQRDQATQNETP